MNVLIDLSNDEKPDIKAMFIEFNKIHFDNKIPDIPVIWNSRLRTRAGQIRYYKSGKLINIEMADKLFENNNWDLNKIKNTLLHEMIHAYLIHLYRDDTHGARFQRKMDSIVGYKPSHTYHRYDTSGLRNKRKHVVNISCEYCGLLGSQKRMPNRGKRYSHRNCGGSLLFEKVSVEQESNILIDLSK